VEGNFSGYYILLLIDEFFGGPKIGLDVGETHRILGASIY